MNNSPDLPLSPSDESPEEFAEDESPFSGGFDRRLARQFSGDEEGDDEHRDDFDREEQSLTARPLSMRSLQWIRKNMTSLRIIVSLQRVTPPDSSESRPRKASGS